MQRMRWRGMYLNDNELYRNTRTIAEINVSYYRTISAIIQAKRCFLEPEMIFFTI